MIDHLHLAGLSTGRRRDRRYSPTRIIDHTISTRTPLAGLGTTIAHTSAGAPIRRRRRIQRLRRPPSLIAIPLARRTTPPALRISHRRIDLTARII
ncbi:hypothetical protein OS122_29875 [Mycolicibacterium mucogenicum]|uniref:hypothetical protein n=1 Tax=Mycolicibacterium mucogenicum TaxID=56689 RepID=UPI00226ADFCB|nr:hypothetical protein [Mycolicibacterium mucogenicum]MCX8565096.1 hypothetical protein [Mycolicibacterium mucogenicum]